MHKCLHLICPTDCLESIINSRFKCENYFYTSLGNSVMFDANTICKIKTLIKKHGIREITFVLSNNNPILFDSLENQNFSSIRGLKNFYKTISKQKVFLAVLKDIDKKQFMLLSYYLNKKISALKFGLKDSFIKPVKVIGKIYNKQDNSFNRIYSDLICIKKHNLN